MTSLALENWQGTRAEHLARLYLAHEQVGGTGPGRRWLTTEINQAIIVRLAAEFQAFCRDLYLEAAAAVAESISNPAVASVVQQQFGTGVKLTRENAQPASIGADFGRFGSPSFWDEMASHYPAKTRRWKKKLELLNQARNALAHQDDQKLLEFTAKEHVALDLKAARGWHRSLQGLALAMDGIVHDRVMRLTGTEPW